MSTAPHLVEGIANNPYSDDRVDLACAFRWTVKLDMHEAVANHFSFAVNEDGTRFLMNPNQMHFARIKASDLILIDANDPSTMDGPNAPDPTAWGLHGAIHRKCPHARCIMHVHSVHATVLASLADSRLQPVDQNSAIYFNRVVIDENYGGLAFEEEGERCAALLTDPKKKVMVMGNHGILVIGDTIADTFHRMFLFERAAQTYIKALSTGQKLRILSDEIAEKVATEVENYPDGGRHYLEELKLMLDEKEPEYRH